MDASFESSSPLRSLSILVPVFNERDYLPRVIERIEQVTLPGGLRRQIVIVDDGSTDGTREMLSEWRRTRPDLVIHLHDRNHGKGAAIRTGLVHATGDLVLVQDADLE